MSNDWEKQVVDRSAWLERQPHIEKKLFAMYSSVADCIVTDPSVMVVPVDDHIVHRGDGVFESFKCIDGNLYNLEDHLIRLERSCAVLGIELPVSLEGLIEIISQTVRAGEQSNALVRLLVSRGTGTMGINPYACLHAEFYIVVYELPPSRVGELPAGVRVALSQIPVKPGIFAQVKTCNYLPNVLMKKEAVDQGVDFTISLDEQQFLAEGATENVGIVTPNLELFMPPPERVLAGTTARRAMEFSQQLVKEGLLHKAEYRSIDLPTAHAATEIHIYGTTLNITPVIEFDGQTVANGKPGSVACRLFEMLKEEMVPASTRLTPVFD